PLTAPGIRQSLLLLQRRPDKVANDVLNFALAQVAPLLAHHSEHQGKAHPLRPELPQRVGVRRACHATLVARCAARAIERFASRAQRLLRPIRENASEQYAHSKQEARCESTSRAVR